MVSPIIGEGPEARRMVRVGEWRLTAWVGRGDEEPKIRDLDLAERLGYERPTDVRYLIKRMVADGKLKDIHQIHAARTTPGRAAREFWLTEAQALKVIAKSETASADAILDEVIHVYILARRGLLGPMPATPEGLAMALRPVLDQIVTEATVPLHARIVEQGQEIIALRETTGKLLGAVGELAQAIAAGHALAVDTNKLARRVAARTGTIDGEEVDRIRDKVARIVEIRAAQMGLLGDRRAMAGLRADVYADLFACVEWGRKGQGIATMPAEKGPIAKAHLDYQIRKLLKGKPKTGAALGSQKQGKLFDEKPN